MNVVDTLAIGRPVTRGPLTLYPLFTSKPVRATHVPSSVAASSGLLVISEDDGGQVPTLLAMNFGDAPVLFVEGETFEGGLQNRVLNVSVLLAPGEARIPVSCVEAGRWESRGAMIRSDRRAPRRLRRVKNQTVQQSLRRDGTRFSDQSAVWQEVDHTLDTTRARNETAALHSAFDALDDLMRATGRERDAAIDAVAELTELGPLPGQAGVVVAAGGRCLAADLFDQPETLAAYWRQIVASNAFDLPSKHAEAPSLDRALRFVRRILHADETSAPGVGLGTERHFASDRIVAHALEWNSAIVHLSVLAA